MTTKVNYRNFKNPPFSRDCSSSLEIFPPDPLSGIALTVGGKRVKCSDFMAKEAGDDDRRNMRSVGTTAAHHTHHLFLRTFSHKQSSACFSSGSGIAYKTMQHRRRRRRRWRKKIEKRVRSLMDGRGRKLWERDSNLVLGWGQFRGKIQNSWCRLILLQVYF